MKLTSKKLDKLPSYCFAMPRERKYLIDTKENAIKALEKVARSGSQREQRLVRRRIFRRFPSLRREGLSGDAIIRKR